MISKSQKNIIQKELMEWVKGIQEDEPVPYEVKHIYFIVSFVSGDIELSYSGNENRLTIFDYGFYSPLEGQYFYCNELKNVAKILAQKKSTETKTEVYNFLKTACLSVASRIDFLKDKKIYFGNRFEKLKDF
jgi:hypothetical protein